MEFEDNTRTRNHYIGDLNYHIIFSTKFRRKCLSNIENELYDAFRYCESKSHFKIKTMKQDKDHIHLLVNIKPTSRYTYWKTETQVPVSEYIKHPDMYKLISDKKETRNGSIDVYTDIMSLQKCEAFSYPAGMFPMDMAVWRS